MLGALAAALLVVAPRVSPVEGEAGAWWADATGMERHGGDPHVAQALLEAVREAGLTEARVGLAGCCVAAELATRSGSAWRVVPPGRDGAFIAHRPLAHLPLPPGLDDTLRELGLERCSDLRALPPAEVELRFGSDGVRAWRLAGGDDPRWPFRPAPPDRAAAEIDFEPPISGTEPMRFVLAGLVESVSRQVAERQRLPLSLRLEIGLDDRSVILRHVASARPTGEPRVWMELVRLDLEGVRLGAPIVHLRLEAEEEGAARADQLDVFERPRPDPASLLAALARVAARWGEGAFVRAEPLGAHAPLAHARWAAVAAAAVAAALAEPRIPAAERGREPDSIPALPTGGTLRYALHRLDPPLPARVVCDGSGRPVRLAIAGSAAQRVEADGPERVSTSWWEMPRAGDYWVAAGEGGELWLLRHDRVADRWQVEGRFD